MRAWLRCRVDPAVLAMLVTGAVTVPVLGSLEMPLIRLGAGPAPYALVLPAVTASGLVGACQRGHLVYESIACRPIGRILLCATLWALVVLSAVWAAIGTCAGGLSFDLMAARNLAGYVGIGLLLLRLVDGVVATAAPLVYAVAVGVLGSRHAALWSWPLHPTEGGDAFISASVLLVAGLRAVSSSEGLRALARRELVP
jgi:hypothetical protein